jgi:hypothetical protein
MRESQPLLDQPMQDTNGPRAAETAQLSQFTDEVIEHADGTLELNGYIFQIDWDSIDPPEDHPDADEISHEAVMAEMCELMGLPPNSL